MTESSLTRRWALAVLSVTLVLPGGRADAQSGSETAVRPGWSFVPSFTFGGAWDDNVLLVGSESAELLPSEYVTALTPAGALHYSGRRFKLATLYHGSFVVYRELSELNSLDQTASGSVQYRWTPRVTIRAGQSFASSRETDALEFIGVPFRRIANRRSVTSGGVEVKLSPRTAVDGGYSLRFVDFDEVELVFPGGHEHTFSGAVKHQLTQRMAVGGTYEHRRMIVVDSEDPITLHHASGTADYRLNEFVTIDGGLGVSRVFSAAPGHSSAGLAGRIGLHARAEHFTTSLYYERSMLPAFGFGGTFHNEELAGTVQGAFARNRAYWLAGAAWRDNDPLVTDPLDPIGPSRRSVWLNSRIGYRVSPWLSAEGYLTQAYQDAQRPGGKVERTRLGFQIVTSKPLRIAP